MTRHLTRVLLALALLTCVAAPASATVFSYNNIASPVRADGPYTVGSRITVGSSAQKITHLGVQDTNAVGVATDGFLTGGTSVGLWSADGTTLHATANVVSASPLFDTYRYAALTTPFTLQPNTDYLIGAVVGGTEERFIDNAAGAAPFSALAGFTIAQNRFAVGGVLAAPVNDGTLTLGRWAPANATELPGAVIFDTSTTSAIRGDGPYTVGDLIRIGSMDQPVTHLGIQDVGLNGLAAGSQVGVWTAGGTLLASATVTSADDLILNYRYAKLATPLTLSANMDYLIGALVGGSFEPFYDGSSTGTTPYSANAGYSLVQNRFAAGGVLSAPLSDGGGALARWGPANLLNIQTIPEPGTASLAMLGLAGLLARRRVRQGSAQTHHSAG